MNEDIINGNSSGGAFCPSCERFIGPADVCPFCDCDSARKPVYRFLTRGSVLLAVAGLFFLYMMAAHSEVPAIRISDITPMMNFGLVRISGIVEKEPFIAKRKGKVESVSFHVVDGSGQVRVVAYDSVAQALVERNLAPERKSQVDIAGNLNISADGNVKLILRSADEIRIGERVK